MLCTRMQLTERRFRIKSSLTFQNSDGEHESKATVSGESRAPFVRPCAVIKMNNCDNGDGKESVNSEREASESKSKSDIDNETDDLSKTDAHGNQTNLDK